jgi:membrane associated rhomboid family serine protease
MPRKRPKPEGMNLAGYLVLLGYCLVFWIGSLVILIANPDTQSFTGPMVFLLLLPMIYLAVKAWDKAKEKPKPQTAKPLWDVSFSSRKPQPAYATYGLIGFLALVFFLEMLFAFDRMPGTLLGPGPHSLIALGGSCRILVLGQGEWYRLSTAVLLHASTTHFIANALALLIAGKIMENLTGRFWFLAIFFITGLGGSGLSMALNPSKMMTVGASGAIMGLMATGYVISFQLRKGKNRKRLQIYLFQVLVLNLLPFLNYHSDQHVDIAAHLGGALTGAAIGLLLLFIRNRRKSGPEDGTLGRVLAYTGLGVYTVSLVFGVTGFVQAYQLQRTLVP